uniref:Uncharacterized protein n=1 Tax=Heterorhabditis bacteriophora TaxID=37862 RepID=A0A1I7XK79_HETBA
MFMIRCLQWTTIIERTFYADTAEVVSQVRFNSKDVGAY